LRPLGVSGASSVSLTATGRVLATLSGNRAEIAAASASVGAFPFSASEGDDAVIVEMSPGSMTATARTGVIGGEVIVEVYKIRDNSAPAQPTDVVVTQAAGRSITLAWSGNGSPKYGIYRSTLNRPEVATKIAETATAGYVDGTIDNGPRYYYWVTGFAVDGRESGKSNPASGTFGTGA